MCSSTRRGKKEKRREGKLIKNFTTVFFSFISKAVFLFDILWNNVDVCAGMRKKFYDRIRANEWVNKERKRAIRHPKCC